MIDKLDAVDELIESGENYPGLDVERTVRLAKVCRELKAGLMDYTSENPESRKGCRCVACVCLEKANAIASGEGE